MLPKAEAQGEQIKWTPNLSKIVSGLVSRGYLAGTVDICISVETPEQMKQVQSLLDNATTVHLIVTHPNNKIVSEKIHQLELNL